MSPSRRRPRSRQAEDRAEEERAKRDRLAAEDAVRTAAVEAAAIASGERYLGLYEDVLRREFAAAREIVIGGGPHANSVAEWEVYRGREADLAVDLFGAKLWRGERAILESLSSDRFVTVRAGRKVSKTEAGALAVLAFLYSAPTLVLTIAPTGRQVKEVIWQRVASIWNRAKRRRPDLPGKLGSTSLHIGPEHMALGFASDDPSNFHGWHAGVSVPDDPDAPLSAADLEALAAKAASAGVKRLLLIVEEAAGVETSFWDALSGSLAGVNVHVLLLGNATLGAEDDHFFVRSFRPGSGFRRIRISSLPESEAPLDDDPTGADLKFYAPSWLVDPKWIEKQRNEWTTTSPLWWAYVLGWFPAASLESRFVTRPMLVGALAGESALEDPGTADARHLGVDISRQGSDDCVAVLWINGVVSARHVWHLPDLMATSGVIVELMHDWGVDGEEIPARNVHVDAVGMGGGVVDRLRQLGYWVDAVDVGGEARYDWKWLTGQTLFANRKAELHWIARRLLEERRAAIPEKYAEIWKQAVWTRYAFAERAGGTKVSIHPEDGKDGLRARYGRSPDDWDATLLGLSRGGSPRPGFAVARDVEHARVLRRAGLRRNR